MNDTIERPKEVTEVTLAYMIEVMEAAERGEEIEWTEKENHHPQSSWISFTAMDHKPRWNWSLSIYRVKPVPREFFINEYTGGGKSPLYSSKEEADRGGGGMVGRKLTKLVEVLGDE